MSADLRVLRGEEAVALIGERPDDVLFRLKDFGIQFGISDEDVLAELIAGRLVADCCEEDLGKLADELWEVGVIPYPEVLRWVTSATPTAAKVRSYLSLLATSATTRQ